MLRILPAPLPLLKSSFESRDREHEVVLVLSSARPLINSLYVAILLICSSHLLPISFVVLLSCCLYRFSVSSLPPFFFRPRLHLSCFCLILESRLRSIYVLLLLLELFPMDLYTHFFPPRLSRSLRDSCLVFFTFAYRFLITSTYLCLQFFPLHSTTGTVRYQALTNLNLSRMPLPFCSQPTTPP
jgi:hypothetical protein